VSRVGRVIVALADRPEAVATARAGRACAELLGSQIEGIHVQEADDVDVEALPSRVGFSVLSVRPDERAGVLDPVAGAIRRALGSPDVVLGVVGSRTATTQPHTGHVALEVADSSRSPLLVVPPSSTLSPQAPVRRVLVPLDDALATTTQLEDIAATLTTAGAELIAVHVFNRVHVPPHLDSEGHALEAIRAALQARHAAVALDRLELRRGAPWEAIRRCIDEFEIDVLLLGWGQRRDEGRAGLVQRALRESPVPVLLMPPRPPS
jgi:hypothetical protein